LHNKFQNCILITVYKYTTLGMKYKILAPWRVKYRSTK